MVADMLNVYIGNTGHSCHEKRGGSVPTGGIDCIFPAAKDCHGDGLPGGYRTDTSMSRRSNCHPSQQSDTIIRISRCAGNDPGDLVRRHASVQESIFHERDFMTIMCSLHKTGIPGHGKTGSASHFKGTFPSREVCPEISIKRMRKCHNNLAASR